MGVAQHLHLAVRQRHPADLRRAGGQIDAPAFQADATQGEQRLLAGRQTQIGERHAEFIEQGLRLRPTRLDMRAEAQLRIADFRVQRCGETGIAHAYAQGVEREPCETHAPWLPSPLGFGREGVRPGHGGRRCGGMGWRGQPVHHIQVPGPVAGQDHPATAQRDLAEIELPPIQVEVAASQRQAIQEQGIVIGRLATQTQAFQAEIESIQAQRQMPVGIAQAVMQGHGRSAGGRREVQLRAGVGPKSRQCHPVDPQFTAGGDGLQAERPLPADARALLRGGGERVGPLVVRQRGKHAQADIERGQDG